MKIQLLLFLLLITLSGYSQNKKEALTRELVSAETDRIYDKLVKIRRDIYANPELAGNEKRTQEIIKKYLLDLGIEVKTDTYGHSIIGILNGEKKERR
ncbi:hypothetical protein [Pedobacter panaciterrae]